MCVPDAPEIAPLSEQSLFLQGQRLRLTCLVTRGDVPLKFAWVKDGAVLNLTSGSDNSGSDAPEYEALDEFSTSLKFREIKPHHAGNYTCVVSNGAASAMRSAEIVVTGQYTKTIT